MVRSWLSEAGFRLRRGLLGRIPLRAGPPLPEIGPRREAERIFYLSVMERILPDPARRARIKRLVDVGCRNWSYAGALAEAFPEAELVGVELDPGRRFLNLHRRGDYARAYAREIGRARCLFADFLELEGLDPLDSLNSKVARADLFTFFFPFVSRDPCLAWGLPPRYADFRALLAHALRLAPHAALLSLHQGEWEYHLAQNAYMTLGVSTVSLEFPVESFPEHWPGKFDVYGILAENPNAAHQELHLIR